MKVPTSPGGTTSQSTPAQQGPSQAALLMAAAQMQEESPSTHRDVFDTPDKSWYSGMKARGTPLGSDKLNPKDLFEDPATGRIGRRT